MTSILTGRFILKAPRLLPTATGPEIINFLSPWTHCFFDDANRSKNGLNDIFRRSWAGSFIIRYWQKMTKILFFVTRGKTKAWKCGWLHNTTISHSHKNSQEILSYQLSDEDFKKQREQFHNSQDVILIVGLVISFLPHKQFIGNYCIGSILRCYLRSYRTELSILPSMTQIVNCS